MVEDIVASVDDNSLERKSEEYTGFRKFLFGALKALDLNVSDYIGEKGRSKHADSSYFELYDHNCSPGGLDVSSVRSLTRTAQGEDPMSGIYTVVADGIVAFLSFVYGNL